MTVRGNARSVSACQASIANSKPARAADLFHLDLAYTPPFATTTDPVLYTGMALDNAALRGSAPLMTPAELIARQAAGERIQVVDVRSEGDFEKSHVDGAIHHHWGATTSTGTKVHDGYRFRVTRNGTLVGRVTVNTATGQCAWARSR